MNGTDTSSIIHMSKKMRVRYKTMRFYSYNDYQKMTENENILNIFY